jgi:hypothetical protein
LGSEELRRVDVQLGPETEEDNSCFFGSLKLQSKKEENKEVEETFIK